MKSPAKSIVARALIPAVLLVAGCAALPHPTATVMAAAQPLPSPAVEAEVRDILSRHGVTTAGVGIIRGGALVWEGYFGEQSPGVPASASTRFNVASVTKTVAAETLLRLVDQGRLSLDEPMSGWWVDPDVAGDPRLSSLTLRTTLNHTSGFPNWRFFLRGGRLAFQSAPGERYGYSGEGLEYAARYAERKLRTPFPDLVRQTVLDPVGMTDTLVVVQRADAPATLARPVDQDGVFPGYWCRPASAGGGGCRPDGSFSAADEMVTTVRDYARFLRAVADSDGYGPALTADRDRVQTDKGDQRIVDCAATPEVPCPDAQGYGLGFNLLRYGDTLVLGHGGADWSELAIVYISKPSRSGIIIFLNAPNRRALEAMPEVLQRMDPTSPFLPEYRRWRDEARARSAD